MSNDNQSVPRRRGHHEVDSSSGSDTPTGEHMTREQFRRFRRSSNVSPVRDVIDSPPESPRGTITVSEAHDHNLHLHPAHRRPAASDPNFPRPGTAAAAGVAQITQAEGPNTQNETQLQRRGIRDRIITGVDHVEHSLAQEARELRGTLHGDIAPFHFRRLRDSPGPEIPEHQVEPANVAFLSSGGDIVDAHERRSAMLSRRLAQATQDWRHGTRRSDEANGRSQDESNGHNERGSGHINGGP